MAERPIIFSAPMVRAILAGCKTMTRRIIKPQPKPFICSDTGKIAEIALVHTEGESHPRIAVGRVLTGQSVRFAVGDRLWVREAWKTADSLDKFAPNEIGLKCTAAGYLGPWTPI